MPSLNRSYAIALLAGLSGIAALVGTYLFVVSIPEPPPGSDGFAHGLAGAAAIIYGFAALLTLGSGGVLAGLEATDSGRPRQRLVAQVGAALAAVGPPLVAIWVVFDGPVELTGVGLALVAGGTILVGVAAGWVLGSAVLRAVRG